MSTVMYTIFRPKYVSSVRFCNRHNKFREVMIPFDRIFWDVLNSVQLLISCAHESDMAPRLLINSLWRCHSSRRVKLTSIIVDTLNKIKYSSKWMDLVGTEHSHILPSLLFKKLTKRGIRNKPGSAPHRQP